MTTVLVTIHLLLISSFLGSLFNGKIPNSVYFHRIKHKSNCIWRMIIRTSVLEKLYLKLHIVSCCSFSAGRGIAFPSRKIKSIFSASSIFPAFNVSMQLRDMVSTCTVSSAVNPIKNSSLGVSCFFFIPPSILIVKEGAPMIGAPSLSVFSNETFTISYPLYS